ncbi:MAG: aminoacyl--tRNA ligase-related protein, partial [Propioniciclava sp.]
MPGTITVVRSDVRETVGLETTTTGLDLFGSDRSIVAQRVNGELRDLAQGLADGDVVEPVLIGEPDGLSIVRHSAAHVAAQALQSLRVDARLGIGPPVTDGFYYDFLTEPLTPQDLTTLTRTMSRIVKERQRFVRRVVTDDQARADLAEEPFKLELIELKGADSDAEGASVEVGAGELTIYDNVRRDGSVAWRDLCRGPHVPHTGYLGNGWALTRTAAAYWRGDQANAQLQRLYGTAWATKEDLQAHQARLEEAAKRDHRRLGTELDLFSFHDMVGSGLPLFHPKGGVIKREMEDYVRARHIEEGFDYVGTPHIAKEDLYYTSGHLPYYADGMFPPLLEDVQRDDTGAVIGHGQAYRLKAMNCPMHNLIFSSRGRSYRELPLRLFEFGTVYRDEKSGV